MLPGDVSLILLLVLTIGYHDSAPDSVTILFKVVLLLVILALSSDCIVSYLFSAVALIQSLVNAITTVVKHTEVYELVKEKNCFYPSSLVFES